jgi:hypothetical protein
VEEEKEEEKEEQEELGDRIPDGKDTYIAIIYVYICVYILV